MQLEMAEKMSSALWEDDPERWGFMEKAARGKTAEFLESFTRK